MDNQPNEWVTWIEEAIYKEHINYYEYKDFHDIQEIGSGGFSKVYRAYWKNTDRCFALKDFFELGFNVKQLVSEIKFLRAVDFHENIIKFYGITKTGDDKNENRYAIVMEYAGGGTLLNYLKNNYDKLNWNDKYNLAYQLASAVSCLHDKGIIHGDLQPSNISMHLNKIKLIDFGLSKRVKDSDSTNMLFGVIPYVDPKLFDSRIKYRKYSLNEKSDVYSVGILLWVISSARLPFYPEIYDVALAMRILQGLREKVVPNTPDDYVKIYTICWDDEPDNRPTIDQVVLQLRQLMISSTDLQIQKDRYQRFSVEIYFSECLDARIADISDLIEKPKNDLSIVIDELVDSIFKKPNKGKEESAIKQHILDFTNKNKIQEIYNWLLNNQDRSNYIFLLGCFYHHGIETRINKQKAFELYQKTAVLGNSNGINMLGYCYENGIGTSINKQMATELYQKAENLKNVKHDSKDDSKIASTIVSGLVDLFIKITNEGKARGQRRSIIDDYLSLHDITIEGIYKWLYDNNKADPSYGYFLGYLYFSGIGTSLNIDKAFVYFYKASLDHQAISYYYLGICYEFGFGTKINKKLAFGCYERSVKKDSVAGKFALGICYEKGIGTVKSESTAMYWYQKAADSGHAIAQYYVGNFYQFGVSVNIDYNKAFHYYSLSANNECSYSINMLGYCYLKGIGTSIDKTKAFKLYLKAANMNNKIAQCNVAICYEDGVGTKKDPEKAMEWYKKLDNDYNEFEGKEVETKKQIIQQWKLNHGLFLDGYRIQPSKQAVLAYDGDLDISLYKGDPVVYININDPDSPKNLLCLNNDNNYLNDALKQLDMCINFPVAEITYEANLLDSVSQFAGDKEKFHELYGHILANKFLAGGQLFVKNFTLTPSKQINIFKFYLIWAYNSAKNNEEIPFSNDPFDGHFLPRLETSNGEEIKSPKELFNWMNNLYQDNMLDIISYNNLRTLSDDDFETLIEKQPGIANYEEKLKLEEWIMREYETTKVEIANNAEAAVIDEGLISTKKAYFNYVNLITWINDFHLLKGLTINESHIIGYSKKAAINFIEAPKVNLSNKSYFEMTNPTTQLEENLLINNIFSTKNIRSFPFIKSDNDLSDKDSIHLIVKHERYEILINRNYIKPSEEFNNAIEKALNNMKPSNALQNVFDEYGHLFPFKNYFRKIS
ncbi:uncharacterized protein OCT59_019287 [Rhizophagus irregularis]|uniref:Bck1p n=1 Tax=Rhizophagus irregularis (strain DAOM 197198w) TaxID=1432141 RepID=A0A015LU24_RHIIW|nr:Bck1p [Rhizophagus irregularis DAOM 197198w]UZO27079.1 hypothetical protein OCT59_019287 [Rhizophagus irregularis]